MKIRIKNVPNTNTLNAKKWKHGLGGNLYEFGGDGGNNPRIVTTGGAGYVPSTNINPEEVKNKIRKNLYDNVNTHSYQSLSDAILGGLGVKSTATNRIIESQDELTDANGNYIDFNAYESPMDDAIWATYLGIPKNQRRKRSGELKISKYTPSIGKENGTIYYEFPITDPKYVIHKSDNLPINGNKVVDMDYYGAINVGDFTVGRGYDSRGEYRSVYDKWDINPFRGVYRKKGLIGNIGNRLLGKKGDLSFGIGKPVNLYNRIYLDDYYKVPAPYRGGVYLPEVTVYGKKKKKAYGGNLFDGTSQPTQQMNNGKVLVTNSYGDNYYIDPRQVNSTEWNLTTPEVSVTADPDDVARGRAERWFRDFGIESNDATSVAGERKQNSHLDEWGIEGAAKAAAWAKDHPVLNNVGLGLSTIPFAVAALPFGTSATEALPTIISTLAPGSSFWMNPVTQQIAKSTLGGITADAISTVATGNTIGGNVRETIGWQPNNEWAKLGYELLTDIANPGYMFGAKRPGFDIVPSPIVPSRGSAQMNHGRNFGTFRPETFNNWGSESLTHLTKDYVVKVPKQSKTPVDVGPKTFDDLGWRYRAAVNQKLSANKIAGFEPYEYIGYHTTEDGYVPVFRQKRLTLMGENTPEGKIFNEDALSDIEREMRTHSGLWKSWNIGDYGPAHNIGKNAEGVGRLFDANYAREPITWIMQNFPRKWEISPIGNARLFGNTLERSANE